MYNRLKRAPIGVQDPDEEVDDERPYSKYKLQSRGEYEDLMMEFEFRCSRAAMMNYFEGSGYDKSIFRMEIIAAFLGSMFATPVVIWFQPETSLFSSSFIEIFSQLGAVGMIVVAVQCLLYFLWKGISQVIPTLSRRADVNVAAAAAWQRLAQTTRSYRIRLDNPELNVKDYATWYERLLAEREKLCAMASIPQSTYNKFDDPDLVYQQLKRRRQMFLHIIEQERLEP